MELLLSHTCFGAFYYFYKFSTLYLILHTNRVTQIEMPVREKFRHVVRFVHGLNFILLLSVYEDVPKALESWTDGGRKVYIYSSGSIEAQKLLFSHSQNNDLTKVTSNFM